MDHIIYQTEYLQNKITMVDATHDDFVIMRIESRIHGNIDLYLEAREVESIAKNLLNYAKEELQD